MQIKGKTKTILAIILTAIISVAATYAAFLLSYPITTTMIIKPKVSMSVFDTDGLTPLTSIDLGQFERGMWKFFPGGDPAPPTQYYYINNTDEQSFYVDFLWSDAPPETPSVDVFVKRGDKTSFTQLSATDSSHSSKYPYPIMTKLEDPDPATQYVVWYFNFATGWSVPFATYTPILTITAWDSLT